MADIRVAVIGVGNVGATLVQGVDYYGSGKNTIGLWHHKVAGLKPANVKVVTAFDIDPAKVGRNLSQVAGKSTRKYHDMNDSKVAVSAGILADGDSKIDQPVRASRDEFAKELKKSGAQVV